MIQGHITISREFFHSSIWTADRFTIGQALLDLMQLASYKDSIIVKRGIIINIHRGNVAWSEVRLAERWNVSRGKVRRMLKQLEEAGEIKKLQKYTKNDGSEQQISRLTTVLHVIHFEEYQKTVQQTEQQTEQQTDIEQNSKRTSNSTYSIKENKESKESLKEKKKKKPDLFPEQKTTAEEIYKIHPRKGNKKDSLKAIQTALKKHSAELLLQQTQKYKELADDLPEIEKGFLYGSKKFFKDNHFLPTDKCWNAKSKITNPKNDKSFLPDPKDYDDPSEDI